MLMEQIIENELRGPLVPWPYVCSTTGYFHDKTKISKKNLQMGCYLLLKYCWMQCALHSQSGPNHLQNLTQKCKILNVF